ncbi:hypothetical protein FACS1894147_04290 [Spirochaetia bacterium]|nr:hypothetical protein FACS1894147_04290 [Spirochaetia bacterium]
MKEVFPMGFWNYPQIDAYPLSKVKDWADLGMTITLSPNFNHEVHDKKLMLDVLDEAQKLGIKLIIFDSRTHWKDAKDKEMYRKKFREAYEDFGKHPATYGFFVGDEPRTEAEFDNCFAAITIQHEEAPSLFPHLNLLPYWKGESWLGGKTLDAWLTDFIARSGIDFLCYDHYSQMEPEEEGTDNYFLNLRLYDKAAKAAGIPFWTTLLSTGLLRCRCPTQDDFRWQVSTAAASGCRGILWFFIYDMDRRNYRNAPISLDGRRTIQYEWLAYELNRFKDNYGELLMSLTFKDSYHLYKSYGGYPDWQDNATHKIVRRVWSEHRTNGIVSLFNDKEGREYILLVNNSKTDADLFIMALDPKFKTLCNLHRNGTWEEDFALSHWDAHYKASDIETQIGVYLAPGQMEIFRLL